MALDYILIGERLREARLKKNYTQEKLAEILDVSVPFVSRIERGNSHISLKRLSEICSFLDVSEGYILNYTSSDSTRYLSQEFSELLEKCPAHKQRLIYNIAKIIAESE